MREVYIDDDGRIRFLDELEEAEEPARPAALLSSVPGELGAWCRAASEITERRLRELSADVERSILPAYDCARPLTEAELIGAERKSREACSLCGGVGMLEAAGPDGSRRYRDCPRCFAPRAGRASLADDPAQPAPGG